MSSGLRAFTARSWTMLASIVLVVAAMLAFFITGSPDPDPAVAGPSSPEITSTSEAPTARPRQPDDEPREQRERRREPRRERPARPSAYVEVFNNSGITGLADQTAGQLSGAGWEVVGTDNWYGDISASTVYYPSRLREQAGLLADEVGASRIRPSVAPMRFDRLTLILTGDL